MRKAALLLMLFFPSLSFATPPLSISLSYDVDQQSLHVEAIHPTQNLLKNYVRLMKVYVNGQEAYTHNYSRQEEYDKFTDDVPLTAKEGDIIKVELFSFSGGSMSQELKVVKETSTTDDKVDT